MINLIPNQEKKGMRRSFYGKLVVLFFITASMSVLALFVAILPAYFTSSVKNNLVDAKLDAQVKEPVPLPDQTTLSVIKDLDKKMRLIEGADKGRFIVSKKVINAVILNKMPEIKITDISYENTGTADDSGNITYTKKISVQGTAPSREALLSFRKALEEDANFKTVDLPISNFVKGSDIQFYLSLVPGLNEEKDSQ